MAKKGRPGKVRMADVVALIPVCKGNLAAVSRALGVRDQTIYTRARDNAEVQAALEAARQTTIHEITNALIDNAMNGNVVAQMFYLKCQARWRERHDLHITREPDAPVTALSDEQLERLVSLPSSSGTGTEET